MIPSVPHTGSDSNPTGGHDLGQLDDIALLSLLLDGLVITAGWVPFKKCELFSCPFDLCFRLNKFPETSFFQFHSINSHHEYFNLQSCAASHT